MSEKLMDLGNGIELWRVDVDELREQDTNARYLSDAAFTRLTRTIQKDSRLESLPFCALTDKGIEIISGHHRVRAARNAQVTTIPVLVDVTGLTRSQIRAKQLAHNAIQGWDDPQLVKQLYEGIEDVDARLESFIDPEKLQMQLEALGVGNVNITFDRKVVLITFLPYEMARFEQALDAIENELDPNASKVYMAELKLVDKFREVVDRVGAEEGVRALGTILSIAADIVLDAYDGMEKEPD